ncbi:MAG: RagB/SusD family nutrient uptake outer membrane protein [Bacteroidaceae bacterium]|nr:RagB/SusD family nutrient uptake outer membrane protein [Bacteroidaceae bacterium]
MKIYKILNNTAAVLAALAIASCAELEEKPESSMVSQQFYNTEADAVAAVNAVYADLNPSGQSIYNSLFQIGVEMATDDYMAGPRARNAHVRAISSLIHDPSNDRMQELWRQSYALIKDANAAIDHIVEIPAANISEEKRQRTINEAKFLRALNYFNLVRWFGDVPLVLHEISTLDAGHLNVVQATEAEVYAQIEQDLKDAENLPSVYPASDLGRATSGAAKTVLSKVYLTQKKWEQAAQKAKEVIDEGNYRLFDDYADVFSVDKENTVEHIFSIQFKGNANFRGNSLASRSAPYEPEGVNGDYADELNVAGGLFQSYRPEDRRLEVNFITQMVSPVNGKLYVLSEPHFYMYYDHSVVGAQGQSSINLPLIRYAEVLLIYAEALNEIEGPSAVAYDAVDQVRRRAGIPTLAEIEPNLSQKAFRDSVFEERRKEFVYQYHRWFDLVRRGSDYYIKTLTAAGKPNAAPRHLHFPIPQREIDLNPNLKQNPDWVNY